VIEVASGAASDTSQFRPDVKSTVSDLEALETTSTTKTPVAASTFCRSTAAAPHVALGVASDDLQSQVSTGRKSDVWNKKLLILRRQP
jgi:hypothetical protein